MTFKRKKLALLGAGNMGRSLLQGILKSKLISPDAVMITGRDKTRLEATGNKFGVATETNNRRAVANADFVLLCTKPQGLEDIADEVRGGLASDALLVSILAGATTDRLEELFGEGLAVVRAMPNIPSCVDAGATAISGGRHADDAALADATAVFEAVGEVVTVSENQMDAVTGLSGSGPAYIYMIIEALTDGGVKMGLPRDVAIKLATQTVMGSAKLVKDTGLHPAILRDQVTTPGGTAIAAIHDLESHGLRPMLISAVVTATERSRALAQQKS
ncbi:MAG: pyrroline-5-carboxylate reductase [Planctomycetota bacterium]